MAITYTWNVVQMDAYPEKDGLTDVVFHVHWALTGTDGTYVGNVYGSVNIPLDESATYTPYNQLTKEQVIGWVKDALGTEGVTSYEENIAVQIQDQINPPSVVLALPWITV
jgi:hypothetical protein